MTQDEIIEMARQAGFPERLPSFYMGCFEKLIVIAYEQGRADERATVYGVPFDAALAEREACAKEADKWSKRDDDVGAFIGKEIRARGEA